MSGYRSDITEQKEQRMPAESNYKVAVVIINAHEPEGEVSGRLLELAEEKGYSPRVVEAQRGEHDAGLSFRVPQDVADAFDADRDSRWPEPDDEMVDDDNDPNTPPVRKARPGKDTTATDKAKE